MEYAAFFRNLNLGRPNCPTKAQFEAAFMAAGASAATSFLTNGTISFTARTNNTAQNVLARACELLREACDLKEPGFIRAMDYLSRLVSCDPFGAVAREGVHACCVSFLAATHGSLAELPTESKRRDVKVLHVTDTEVLSLSLQVGNTPGNPNAFLEKHLGIPVTTRNWNTVVRLVHRHRGR